MNNSFREMVEKILLESSDDTLLSDVKHHAAIMGLNQNDFKGSGSNITYHSSTSGLQLPTANKIAGKEKTAHEIVHHAAARELNLDGAKHSFGELSHMLKQHHIMKQAGYNEMRNPEGGITYHHPSRPFQVSLDNGKDAHSQILRHTNIAAKVSKGGSNADFNHVNTGKKIQGVYASANIDTDDLENKIKKHSIDNNMHFS